MNNARIFQNLAKLSQTPKLELNLHELNQIHKTLIRAHQQARQTSHAAHQAYREASQATVEAYAALSGFEAELQHFQEKHRLSPMEQFKLVTLDESEEEEHG